MKLIKITLSVFGVISLFAVLLLLTGHAIRAELVAPAEYHEFMCKLELGSENVECVKLEELSEKLMRAKDELATTEVAVCALAKSLRISIIIDSCSGIEVFEELRKEIALIIEAMKGMDKHK